MRTRAFRRHRQEVKKAKAKRMIKNNGFEPTPYIIGFRANTMCICSRMCCSGSHKFWGPPIRELRKLQEGEICE